MLPLYTLSASPTLVLLPKHLDRSPVYLREITMCVACGCSKLDTISPQLSNTLRETIHDLETKIAATAESATTMTAIHQNMRTELQSQLAVLEKSHATIKKLECDQARDMAIVDERINTVIQYQSQLNIDDQDDTILMLHAPKKLLVAEHRAAGESWTADYAKEVARSQQLIARAQELLGFSTSAVRLEEAIRTSFEVELQKRYSEYIAHMADNLLQDGIRIWVSKSNIFATLMTECLLRATGTQLTITPTETCFNKDSLRELHDKYRLDHTCSDMQEFKFTIDLRNVEELKFTNRRATIPGTCDETSPHWEPPRYHQCVHIRTRTGREYFLADRKSEPQNKAWVSLQKGVVDGSPGLLCQKLVQYWEEATRGRA